MCPRQPAERRSGRQRAASRGRRWRLESAVPHARRLCKDDQGCRQLGLGARCPKAHEGRVLRYTQAKVIGGGSSINAQLYTRGNAADYDLWASEDKCEGWDYRAILPYFKRAEDNQRFADDYHSYGGLLAYRCRCRHCRSVTPTSAPARSSVFPTTAISTAGSRRASASISSPSAIAGDHRHRWPICFRSGIART
jgi:choline dehydrogenase-like flavoprotein